MTYVLGIDQGGSKTYALLADERGELCGFGSAQGASHFDSGLDKAISMICVAAMGAIGQAGITIDQIIRITAGLTGVDWPHEEKLLHEALSQALAVSSDKITVINDSLIALRAGTSEPSGCILCAGSGLNCAVRKGPDCQYVFGYYIKNADQGGMALGKRTLQAVFDAHCGLFEPTALTLAVLEHMGCNTVDELLYKKVTGQLSSKLVLLLPHVIEVAVLEGDAVAENVMESFARDIAQYAVAGLRRFSMLDERTEVVLSGSVFKCKAPILQEIVSDVIRAAAPKAKIVQSEYEPVVGAVLMALDSLPGGDRAQIKQRIKRGALRFDMIRTPQ